MESHSKPRRTRYRSTLHLETLESRVVLDSTVVFHELMYNPVGSDETREWIELHNQMAVDMDLSGWTLQGGVSFRFPEGTTVPGGAYVLVAKDPAAMAPQAGAAAVFGPFAGQLNNAGDQLRLLNRSDRVMDELDYGDHGSWPVGPDGSGATLAKRTTQSGTNDPANWTSSRELGGTPGRANFPIVDRTPVVSTPVPLNATWRYDASGTNLTDSWRATAFDDSNWSPGEAVLYAGSFVSLPPPDPSGVVGGPSVLLQNPSFEANTNGGVGYGSVNGWVTVGGTGVNPSSDGSAPFVDNGRIPDTRRIAFIQGPGSLSQTVSGLDTTKQYWLQLYYNARNCCGASPSLSITLGSQELLPATPVAPVGGSNAFHFISVAFTPRAASAQLSIRNVGGAGDHSLLLDGVSIIQRPGDQVFVQNPSFEATGSAPAAPGYVDSRSVAGWTYDSQGGRFGLNDATGPFHDNGRIPDGRLVTFLQKSGSLQQRITGLEPGQRYELQYHVNSRAGTQPAELRVLVDDRVLHTEQIPAVGDARAYPFRSHRFTATGSSALLTFQQALPDSNIDATLLLDQVAIRRLQSPLVTPLPLGPTTYYFRQTFDYAGDPRQTELELRTFLDDGAVVYLNGAEVRRQNMPDGPIGWTTRAATEVGDPAWGTWHAISSDALVRGRNVLAVEVHQAAVGDRDMAWALELKATDTPVDPTQQKPTLAINELSAAGDTAAAVELYNFGDRPVSLAGHELRLDGAGTEHVSLPNQLLPAGGFTVVTVPLAQPLRSGDRALLVDTNQQILVDAGRIEDGVRARVPDGVGPWYFVDAVTPAAANRLTISDDIVINEIMYHPLPQYATADIPATYQRSLLVPLTWNQWRYNASGASLPANWAHQEYTVDGRTWKLGQGLLGYETANLEAPINTQFTIPSSNNPRFLTYYFQTDLNVSADQLSQAELLQISHMIDAGAVFYLNGIELFRFHMPDGPVNAGTRASANVIDATRIGPVTFSPQVLRAGKNVLSAELHLRTETSSDVVFGAEVSLEAPLSPPIPGASFRERDELEWVELYNKGTQTVDLSGWSLQDAVDYAFEPGTTLAPGQFLVVAANRLAVAEKYPAVATRIVGDYARELSDGGERLALVDARQNPVDVVQYADGLGWPAAADGCGASLELRDPQADNSRAETWAASRPNKDVPWQTYTYRALVNNPKGLAVPDYFDEFVLGLLDAGEVLLDDVRLIEDPDGVAIDRLQNGSFDSDAVGVLPHAWRIIGNHNQSVVAVDPDNPGNHVLQLLATDPTEHMHNHAETTLANGAQIVPGRMYELRFRAKWLSGSPQLNTRLYFTRGTQTTILRTTDRGGTPGAVNSMAEANLGPTYSDLRHEPLAPTADQGVTVSVAAADPAGVKSLRLDYSVNGQSFRSLAMTWQPDGRYQAVIPPQLARATVQFYVEGTDMQGGCSFYPAAGADSRALYRVQSDPLEADGAHTLRLVMTAADVQWLHANENVMSNARLGATLIYDDREVFYDVGIRLRASGYGRQGGLAGFNMEFPADHLFRGEHSGIAIDRGVVLSSGTGSGGVSGFPGASPHELLIYQTAHHAGGIAAMYDDVVYIDAPRSDNTGLAQLKMARYSNEFLDSQFDDGSDGSLYKFELIYHATRTVDLNPESLKVAPNAVLGTDISDLGDDEEAYRHNFILENNLARDDFQSIIELGKAFSLTGTALDTATKQVMDVDQWMRLFALQSLVGVADVYNMGLAHNLDLYVRPSDQKVLAFPWDVDHGFYYSPTAPLLGLGNNNLRKVIELPHNRRLFYKHLLDIVQTTYNVDYLGPWADHYAVLTEQDLATFFRNYVDARSQYVLSELARVAPTIPFAITTNNGNPLTVDQDRVALQGNGWIDVHEVRLAGSQQPLAVDWTSQTAWQIDLPLQPGLNVLNLQAYDYQGRLVGTDEVRATSTVSPRPLQDFLRVVQIMYNPPEPTAAELATNPMWTNEDFEFIELWNTSPRLTLDLHGVRISEGPFEAFDFSTAAIRTLAPEQRLIVVSNLDAFRTRYGTALPVVGDYAGNLSNGGERLRIEDGLGATIADFQYGDGDPWPERADGAGASLVLIDPLITAADAMGKADRWSGGAQFGGAPGQPPSSLAGVVINEIISNPAGQQTDAIELFNTTSAPIHIGGWYLTDDVDAMKFQIPPGTILPARAYVVFDEGDFNPTPNNPAPHHFGLSGTRGDDVWLVTVDAAGQLTQFVDDIHFGPARRGESFSRVPDGAGRLAPTAAVTLGGPNATPRIGPLRISELHYHPAAPGSAALAVFPEIGRDDLEFVAIENPLRSTTDLTGWQLRGDLEYDFPSGYQLASGSRAVVVPFDPDDPANVQLVVAFRANYPSLPRDQRLLGPYRGTLSDDQGLVRLLRAEPTATEVSSLLEDEVFYDDRTPWPQAADGAGKSLQRALPTAHGNAASSWAAGQPLSTLPRPAGDLNGDGQLSATDIDTLCAGLHRGDPRFDLNADGVLNGDDLRYLVEVLLESTFGDANVDGQFNSDDVVRAFQAGEYEDAIPGNSTWAEGDWNCDGEFTSADMVAAFQAGKYEAEAAAQIASLQPSAPRRTLRLNNPESAEIAEAQRAAERGTTLRAGRRGLSYIWQAADSRTVRRDEIERFCDLGPDLPEVAGQTASARHRRYGVRRPDTICRLPADAGRGAAGPSDS